MASRFSLRVRIMKFNLRAATIITDNVSLIDYMLDPHVYVSITAFYQLHSNLMQNKKMLALNYTFPHHPIKYRVTKIVPQRN